MLLPLVVTIVLFSYVFVIFCSEFVIKMCKSCLLLVCSSYFHFCFWSQKFLNLSLSNNNFFQRCTKNIGVVWIPKVCVRSIVNFSGLNFENIRNIADNTSYYFSPKSRTSLSQIRECEIHKWWILLQRKSWKIIFAK